MRELKMKCERCGKEETVFGENARAILLDIDETGWYDFPNQDHTDVLFLCPACKEAK